VQFVCNCKSQSSMTTLKPSSPRPSHRTSASVDDEAKTQWLEQSGPRLPRGLDSIDEIKKAVKEGRKTLAMFLDYDGTLTPIVARPEEARISAEMIEVVNAVAEKYPTSIVTGRNMNTIKEFLADCLGRVNIAASHGFHIGIASTPNNGSVEIPIVNGVFVAEKTVGEEYLPSLKHAYDEISMETMKYPGSSVENNGFSISVHYRNLEPAESSQQNAEKIEKYIDELLKTPGLSQRLRKTLGKKVFEIRPHLEWNKGKAVGYLLNELMGALEVCREDIVTVYIGDDVTDEDAFAVLSSESDFTYLVSSNGRPTQAKYALTDPEDVQVFLKALLLL